ncbi:MAG: hypothetical protein ACI4XB_02995 [Ruminococcus sp.]
MTNVKSKKAVAAKAPAPEKTSEAPQKTNAFWLNFKKGLTIFGPPALLLLVAGIVVYYILFPSKGEFHSDCTDTIYWAKASYDSGTIFNSDFSYACLLPFGGSLLMLIFMPFFGLSMTTHTLGMLLFFLLFLTGFCLMLKEMHWNYRWICAAAAVLLAVVSSSEKLREIFWGHTIYYSLGILFLFYGLFLLFRLWNLLEKKGTLDTPEKERKRRTHTWITFAVLLIFFLLCSTDQITALTIFALPILAAIFLERLLDRHTPLLSNKNCSALVLLMILGVMILCGLKLGKIWAGSITAGYADAYSSFAAQSTWLEHVQSFPLAWLSLLGLEDIPGTALMDGDSIKNIIRMAAAILLLVLPIVATCCYPKYEGKSGKQIRILIWAHWIMTALIMVGYICGNLSAANWRLSPIVCTSAVVSIVYVQWAISNSTSMNRIAGVLCIPVVCFCGMSIWNVAALPKDYYKENVQYQLVEALEEHGLTYGYATFWRANAMTVISDSEILVRNVKVDESGVRPAGYQTENSWYEDQPDQEEYFLLLDQGEYDTLVNRADGLLQQAQRFFSIADDNGTNYWVLVFAENIF